MCGIVAIFARNSAIPAGALERATRGLHHRGPEGGRHWVVADRRVGLGHPRLSIIDLATRKQLIANEDVGTSVYSWPPNARELWHK
jgi:asparagine synthase (glutamine-hydrolysing)